MLQFLPYFLVATTLIGRHFASRHPSTAHGRCCMACNQMETHSKVTISGVKHAHQRDVAHLFIPMVCCHCFTFRRGRRRTKKRGMKLGLPTFYLGYLDKNRQNPSCEGEHLLQSTSNSAIPDADCTSAAVHKSMQLCNILFQHAGNPSHRAPFTLAFNAVP